MSKFLRPARLTRQTSPTSLYMNVAAERFGVRSHGGCIRPARWAVRRPRHGGARQRANPAKEHLRSRRAPSAHLSRAHGRPSPPHAERCSSPNTRLAPPLMSLGMLLAGGCDLGRPGRMPTAKSGFHHASNKEGEANFIGLRPNPPAESDNVGTCPARQGDTCTGACIALHTFAGRAGC